MATGEKSNTWGQITNTNLQVLEQAISGYDTFNVTNASRALTFSSGALSNGKNEVIKLTGTLSTNVNVTIPDSIEKTYIIHNTCDHAGNTLTFKTSSGTGVTLCEGHSYHIYSDGTNCVKAGEHKVWREITAAETVQPGAQLLVDTSSAAVTVTLPASPSAGDEVSFIDSKYTFDTNNLTVNRNSEKIVNDASDLTVAVEGAAFTLVYANSSIGWTYKEK
jgi:hypothetical protein